MTATPLTDLPKSHRAHFVTGRPVTTEVVVGRGLLRDPVAALAQGPEARQSPLVVCTDHTVASLYAHPFVERLRATGQTVHLMIMPDGEQAKTLAQYQRLVTAILDRGIDEYSELVALGGGVVCNVTGMLAATLYRGLGLVHVPTTLMAQADAAISHKQALNGHRGKNLVGAYYAPRRVVVDVEALQTLETRRIRDGYAEIIKHGLAQDAGLLDDLLAHGGDVRDLDVAQTMVQRTVDLKCAVMASDPTERVEGMVLQYGHAIGHAVEWGSNFALLHGEAVAVGMRVAARIARRMGLSDGATEQLHQRALDHFGLPSRVPEGLDGRAVLAGLKDDKRARVSAGAHLALVAAPGRLAQVEGRTALPVPDAVIVEAVDALQAWRTPWASRA
ncbi:MAG: hypothetical protein KC613_07530 [Myxococcales bacterium]|nr:hypothetical protein [Myxococcales bacterium]MCB9523191.1 3-dehydroquinate synthase [Myxococcales bacterium]